MKNKKATFAVVLSISHLCFLIMLLILGVFTSESYALNVYSNCIQSGCNAPPVSPPTGAVSGFQDLGLDSFCNVVFTWTLGSTYQPNCTSVSAWDLASVPAPEGSYMCFFHYRSDCSYNNGAYYHGADVYYCSPSCTWRCDSANYNVDCSTCSSSPEGSPVSVDTGIACSQPNPASDLSEVIKNACQNIPELCDGIDNDCNGQIDDECTAEEQPDDDSGCPPGEVCICR